MLDKDLSHIDKLVKVREIIFLLNNIKVAVEKDIEDNPILKEHGINKARRGETIEVPRWIAEELEEEGLVKLLEEGFEVELFRVLNREKLQGMYQLSPVKADFYLKLRRYLINLRKRKKEAFDRFRIYAQDFIKIRLSKVLSLAISSTNIEQATSNMTPEEIALYKEVKEIADLWKKTMMGEEA